jgi:hypothetical protein
VKIANIFAVVCALFIGTFPTAAQAAQDRLSNSQRTLVPCASPQDFDCIESFSVLYPNGKSSEVQLLIPPSGSTTDELNQTVENSGSTWRYSDLNGVSRKIYVTATLTGENYVSPAYKRRYPAMWFNLLNLDPSEIKSGDKFKVVLRMSWLQPQGVGLFGANGDFSQQVISGGNRYTFIGSPFLSTSLNSPEKYSLLNGPQQDESVSDGEHPTLYFVIDHLSSIPGGTFWDPTCAEFGYSVTSSNAIGAGQPYMTDNETLKFNIGAPHKLSTGELNEGFFSTDFPVAYLNCRWPNNQLSKSPRVEISVVNSDGTTQTATTSVRVENGILKIRANGFHYSSPTIVLKASNNLLLPPLASTDAMPTPSPSPTLVRTLIKKVTITCVKGKVSKIVTGAKPSCPVGYRKK